jgi:hypothetical protein
MSAVPKAAQRGVPRPKTLSFRLYFDSDRFVGIVPSLGLVHV